MQPLGMTGFVQRLPLSSQTGSRMSVNLRHDRRRPEEPCFRVLIRDHHRATIRIEMPLIMQIPLGILV